MHATVPVSFLARHKSSDGGGYRNRHALYYMFGIMGRMNCVTCTICVPGAKSSICTVWLSCGERMKIPPQERDQAVRRGERTSTEYAQAGRRPRSSRPTCGRHCRSATAKGYRIRTEEAACSVSHQRARMIDRSHRKGRRPCAWWQ